MNDPLSIVPESVKFNKSMITYSTYSVAKVDFNTNDGRSWKVKGIVLHTDLDLAKVMINGNFYLVRRTGTS
jgi:hypothetical protein